MEQGTVERTPHIDMLLEHARVFGPLQIGEPSAEEIRRIGLLSPKSRQLALRLLLTEKVEYAKMVARGLMALHNAEKE